MGTFQRKVRAKGPEPSMWTQPDGVMHWRHICPCVCMCPTKMTQMRRGGESDAQGV